MYPRSKYLLFLGQPRYLKKWKPLRSKLCCAIPCTTSFPRVEIRLLAASSAICRRTRTVTLLSAISWRARLLPQCEIQPWLQHGFSMNLIFAVVSQSKREGTMKRSLSQDRKLTSPSLQSTNSIIRSILCFSQVLVALINAIYSRVTLKY